MKYKITYGKIASVQYVKGPARDCPDLGSAAVYVSPTIIAFDLGVPSELFDILMGRFKQVLDLPLAERAAAILAMPVIEVDV
jgi:hypothetical protein